MSLKRVANDRFSAVNSLRPLSGSGRLLSDLLRGTGRTRLDLISSVGPDAGFLGSQWAQMARPTILE
jgi:hypothetical protein